MGGFGVSGPLALQEVSSLSGGQKSRVAFALMAMKRPHLVVLDEPTNHLDVETIEALGKAINKFTVSYVKLIVDREPKTIFELKKQIKKNSFSLQLFCNFLHHRPLP